MDKLLTVLELAERLNVAPKTIYMWRQADKDPPSISLHGRIRYPESDVERWLADRRDAAPTTDST